MDLIEKNKSDFKRLENLILLDTSGSKVGTSRVNKTDKASRASKVGKVRVNKVVIKMDEQTGKMVHHKRRDE